MLQASSRLLVRALPLPLASRLVQGLAARTQRPALHPSQQQALAGAGRLRTGPRGRLAAWTWGTQGPLVLLAHGWNGCAAQLAPLAQALAGQGFRCVALDITGHGESAGRRTAWRHFIDDPAALVRQLGEPVHAMVGHSAGGLAMMAARRIHGLQARHWVCICAPSHPFPPIRAVHQRLNPPPAVLAAYRQHIARQFGTDWAALEAGHAFADAGKDLLLYYDRADKFVDHGEGDRILAWCPGARLVKSEGQGHARVLGADALQASVAEFLGPASRGAS